MTGTPSSYPAVDELADVEQLEVELVLGEHPPGGRRYHVGVAGLGERVRPVVRLGPAGQASLLHAVRERGELGDVAGHQGDSRAIGSRPGRRLPTGGLGRCRVGGRGHGGYADEYGGGGREGGADRCDSHGSSRAEAFDTRAR